MSYEIRQIPWLYDGGHGATYYYDGNSPVAIVLHKMQGWVTTAIGWAVSGYAGASWHFSIRLDGVIYQHLEYRHGGYHAGISDNQARTYPPTWPLWQGLGINVNTYTIGIELEGFSGNAIPIKQREALKWLLHKICNDLNIRYDRDHLPPHADIDVVNRVNDFDYPTMREDLYVYLLEDDLCAKCDDIIAATFGTEARMRELLANNAALEARVNYLETKPSTDTGVVGDHEHTDGQSGPVKR